MQVKAPSANQTPQNNAPMNKLSILCCPKCNGSVELKNVEIINDELIVSYNCQKGHKGKKVPISEILSNSENISELCECKIHQNEKYVAFCTRCQRDICATCSYDEQHETHVDEIQMFIKMLPKKNEIKEFLDGKKLEMEKLNEAEKLTIDWLTTLKEKFIK